MRLIDADALIEDCNIFNGWDAKIVKDVVNAWLDDQPTISQWIPVNERLPNADEMSKCLYVNKYGYYITDAYISEVGGTYECENDYTILCDVVAWMPLPEPYKESDK